MTNSKPVTDNKEKAKNKKKKEAVEIVLSKLTKLQYEGASLSGNDIAAYGDALAGAKVAFKTIESAIKEAESVLKAATLRHYCDYYATKGRAPDLRKNVTKMGTFQVVQQKTAKVTVERANDLKAQGVDLEAYKEKSSYTIRMGKASKEATKQIIVALKDILGDDYTDVVSEYVTVGDSFFDEFDHIVKKSLTGEEALNEKMLSALRVLSPTIQFGKFESDLNEQQGYELAYKFSQACTNKKKAAREAEKEVKAAQAKEGNNG